MRFSSKNTLRYIMFLAFAFCCINAAWAIVGTWSISFGGSQYDYIDHGRRESGIYSCRGYLVIAVRNSFSLFAGGQPVDLKSLQPTRSVIPWHISASMDISPTMFKYRYGNGILDDPRTILPGVLVNWQDPSRGEWYNRGFAVHWLILTALSAVPPATLMVIRRQRRSIPGFCIVCGYDLRATPDRCPECGTAVSHDQSSCLRA